MKRAAVLFLALIACGKTATLDESERKALGRPSKSTARVFAPPPPAPDAYEAAAGAFEAGLAARDRGDHALAERRFREAARFHRPNGLAFARAGLAALAQHAEARANDHFREALADLEEETHERPRPAAHVPLACWGVFFTSVALHWRDSRHLELRCPDGISVIDVPAREEVERVPSPVYERPRATLAGSAADILDDGDATASPDGRFVAHLVALPNPDLDSFHERVPRVLDVATGAEIDLSFLLHDVPPDHVRAPYVIGNALHPKVITRGVQRFAWSVDIEGHEWDWNDEVRCEGDLTAKQNDPLHCLSPYGPIATSEDAAPGDAHCRIGQHVLPLVVCSVGWSQSRSPLVAR